MATLKRPRTVNDKFGMQQQSTEMAAVQDLFSLCRSQVDEIGSLNSLLISKNAAAKDLSKTVYKIINAGIKARVKLDYIASLLEDISLWHVEMPALIVDTFNIIDLETTILPDATDQRSNLSYLMKRIEKVGSDKILKERVDSETLREFELLPNNNFNAKVIKLKTKMFYKQKKFNLLREDNEGYAKLVMHLDVDPLNTSVESTKNNILSLIGSFNLDPIRVLDLIFCRFENDTINYDYYVSLIGNYMGARGTVCELLGFRYSQYHSSNEITPISLYKITAYLIHAGLVSFENLYDWLLPTDESINSTWEDELKELLRIHKNMTNNIVSSRGKDKVAVSLSETMRKFAENQKFGLFAAMISIGDWQNFQKAFDRFPEECVVSQPPIILSMCSVITYIIDPVYKSVNKFDHSPSEPIVDQSLVCPAATSMSDLKEMAFPMLYALGPYLSNDAKLAYKIMRISKAALQQGDGERMDDEDSLYYDIYTLVSECLLPTLSMSENNCPVAEEIWDLFKHFPYNMRYSAYGKWKSETPFTHPQLLQRDIEVLKQIKLIMKKVSKETTKHVGRLIGKLSHSSPCSVFEYILNQISLYDNLIIPIVDSMKFISNLSLDILPYMIIAMLVQPVRINTKHDGVNISRWFTNVAVFCGLAFKKFNLELVGVFQYVANQIKCKQSLDLLLLKEIVEKVTGIEALEEISNDQLMAISGGDLLKQEASYLSQVRNKKSIMRIKESLFTDDLAISLCILIARLKTGIIFEESDVTHLKLIGQLYDQCQHTLVQYCHFLSTTLTGEEYATRLPSIDSLLTRYNLKIESAFHLARSAISYSIMTKYDSKRKADDKSKKWTQELKLQKYYESAKEIITPVYDTINNIYYKHIVEDLTPEFIVMFWSLELSDLVVPTEAYDREINKLKTTSASLESSKEMSVTKTRKEQERIQSQIEKLHDERKKLNEHTERVMYMMEKDKGLWFTTRAIRQGKSENVSVNVAITCKRILQHCLLPRCMFTMLDAIYCAKILHTLHLLRTPNFSTLLCLDRLFNDLSHTVASCSESEARRYGHFLSAVLDTIMKWHFSKAIFDKECAGHPGFMTKLRCSQSDQSDQSVSYENYRQLMHKWHFKLLKSFVACLESKQFIQIRNAIIILTKIHLHFPILVKMWAWVAKRVDKITEEEKNKREDLYVMANSYSVLLKIRYDHCIKEQDFHQIASSAPEEGKAAKTEPVNKESVENGKAEKDSKSSKRSKVSKRSIDSDSPAKEKSKKVAKYKVKDEGVDRYKVKEEGIEKEKKKESGKEPREKKSKIKEESSRYVEVDNHLEILDDNKLGLPSKKGHARRTISYKSTRHREVESPLVVVCSDSDDHVDLISPDSESRHRKSENSQSHSGKKHSSRSYSPDVSEKKSKKSKKENLLSPDKSDRVVEKKRGKKDEGSVETKKRRSNENGVHQNGEDDFSVVRTIYGPDKAIPIDIHDVEPSREKHRRTKDTSKR